MVLNHLGHIQYYHLNMFFIMKIRCKISNEGIENKRQVDCIKMIYFSGKYNTAGCVSDTNQNKSAVIKLRAYTCCLGLVLYSFFPYLTPFYNFGLFHLELTCTTKDGATKTVSHYHCSSFLTYINPGLQHLFLFSFNPSIELLGLNKKINYFDMTTVVVLRFERMPTRD